MPNPSTIARDECHVPDWIAREGLRGSDDVLPPPVDENAEMLKEIQRLEAECVKADEIVEVCKADLKEQQKIAKERQQKLRAFIRSVREGLPMFEKGKNDDDG